MFDLHKSILDSIGNTPLIQLNYLTKNLHCTILAKLESQNPGGSVKDRICLNMINQAKKEGYLRPDFNDDALSATKPLIETTEFTINDLLILANEGNKINPTLTQDKLAQAIRHPVKTLRMLLGKRKMLLDHQ